MKNMIDISNLGEMEREWFKQMIDNEIDDISGTISNERLFAKGADTDEQVMMHEENICRLNGFNDFLRDILTKLD